MNQKAEGGKQKAENRRRKAEGRRRKAIRGRTKILFCCLLLTASCIRFAYACPMCTELIEHGKDAWQAMRFGRGIAWSMLLMFSVPFLLVGGGALFLVYSHRKSVKNQRLDHAGKS